MPCCVGVLTEVQHRLRGNGCTSRQIHFDQSHLSLDAKYNLDVHQMDVRTSFMNCGLNEDIYMTQTDGYIEEDHDHLVCKLQ